LISYHSLESVAAVFRKLGVKRVIVKHLATKQDNEKNQIYLGDSSRGVMTLFPAKSTYLRVSKSTEKRNSDISYLNIVAELDFAWIDRAGKTIAAPHTKLIEYAQYPEARLSGFFRGCPHGPDALRRDKQSAYGSRILMLGYNHESLKTYGLVLTELEDPVVKIFPSLPSTGLNGILLEFLTEKNDPEKNGRQQLLEELNSLMNQWHPSKQLRPGQMHATPFRGNQGAGYTLEALLGVSSNPDKAPDKYGFEIKTMSSKVSLMTPTADLGLEKSLGFRNFMNQFGWAKQSDKGATVFNGTHWYQHICATTNLVLDISGFDPLVQHEYRNDSKIITGLWRQTDKELISGWSFEKLVESWNQKHANACYLTYQSRAHTGSSKAHDKDYKYNPRIYVCQGTNIYKLLKSIANSVVNYDPGHEIKANGEAKQRPQWRVGVIKNFEKRLSHLYDTVDVVEL